MGSTVDVSVKSDHWHLASQCRCQHGGTCTLSKVSEVNKMQRSKQGDGM